MKGKRFCPKCRSVDVRFEVAEIPGFLGQWICNKCGFNNIVFPIKEKLKK